MSAGIEPRPDEVLDHFLLAIHGDRAPARELGHVDSMSGTNKTQLDAVMNQALVAQAVPDARLCEQVDRALLQNSSADTVLDIITTATLDDDGIHALPVQQMRQQ